MPNKNYIKGRSFEYRVMKYYENQGYFVRRQAGSKFPDLLIVPTAKKQHLGEKIAFIECKSSQNTQRLSRPEMEEAKRIMINYKVGFFLAVRTEKGHIKIINLEETI